MCGGQPNAHSKLVGVTRNHSIYARTFFPCRLSVVSVFYVIVENHTATSRVTVNGRDASLLVNATALGLAYPAARQMACTSCSVGISDLKPLTGTSADQLPHTKSRSLATA